MKFRKGLAAVIALSVGVALAACSGGSAAAPSGSSDDSEITPRTLVQSGYIAADSIAGAVETWWMDEVTKRTDGAITFETNWSSALCSGADQIACIGDGRSDIGLVAPQLSPAQFPLTSIDGIPFQIPSSTAFRVIWDRLIEEVPEIQAEYAAAGLTVMYVGGPDSFVLGTAQPLSDLTDLDGLAVRVPGGLASSMSALGMEPVAMASDEIYESLQRGVIDGLVTDPSSVSAYKLYEVAPHFYDLGQHVGALVSTPVAMNSDTWNSLEPAVQKIMTEVSTELQENQSDIIEPQRIKSCTALLDNASLEDIDDSTGWAEDQSTIVLDGWAKSYQEKTGQDPAAFIKEYRAIIDEEMKNYADLPRSADSCIGLIE
jgi:TRAP-type C4-dicarboxylate transport system substrate-binding protein